MKKYLILLFITCALFANTPKDSQYIHKKIGEFVYLIKTPKDFTYEIKKRENSSQNILELQSKSKNSVVTLFENYIYNDVNILTNTNLNEIIKSNKMLSLDDFEQKEFRFKHFKKISSSYIELTDKKLIGKEKKIGDFKYFTTGIISVKNLTIPFIILTNDINDKEYKSIIKMFDESFFIPQDVYINFFR